jgi:hypothetical protein
MLYQHEKPCSQRKQTRVEPSFATTILHIQCSSSIWFASTTQNVLTTWRIKFETFPFLLTLSGVSCLISSRDVYEHSFYELTMEYSIFEKIHLSRVILSFLQYSWNEDPKGWIQLVVMQHINLLKKEDQHGFVKIVEDLCNPFLLFLPRNLGVEILVRWVEL